MYDKLGENDYIDLEGVEAVEADECL